MPAGKMAGETARPARPDARATVPEVGALNEWWRQLHAGRRTPSIRDALLDAAILEARARDAIRDGQPAAAARDRFAAAALLVRAATAAA
jgi:hypothetical protein